MPDCSTDKLIAQKHILMTGGTGLLGSYLVRDLLLDGCALALVVRRERKHSAQDRVEMLVRSWEHLLGKRLPRPVVLEGDVSQPLCGLGRPSCDWIEANCSQLLHNAASLSFRGVDRGAEPWLTNVTGTSHVLDLAHRTGIKHFHHVSTAYVCGLRSGTVLEDDLDVGQAFGNDYELTKVMGEKQVRSAGHLTTATIYRPSIIVGDSRTGYTSTYHGPLAALRLGHTLLTRVTKGSTNSPALMSLLDINPSDQKNCVPVDWVSEVIAHAVMKPEARGQTFHLTHPQSLAMHTMGQFIQDGVNLYSNAASADDSSLCDENWFAENMRSQLDVYQTYFRNDPIFDHSHTTQIAGHIPCPILDMPTLMRMAKMAIECDFGRLTRPSPLPAFDADKPMVTALTRQA
ncbi:MAG: SDR family oxidoreductase [Planctomycetota bacterium]